MIKTLTILVLLILWVGCSETAPTTATATNYRDLEPHINPFGPDDSRYQEQPSRVKPRAMALSRDGTELFVALPGTVDHPVHEVVVVDPGRREIVHRYGVGRSPASLAIHPDGRHLVVANRLSNYLSVIDLKTQTVSRAPVDFYTEGLLFDSRGERLYLSNRWRNAVQVLQVRREGATLGLSAAPGLPGPEGIAVGANPGPLALSADENRLFVASPAALTISVIDTMTMREIDVGDAAHSTDLGTPDGLRRLWVGAPPLDLLLTEDKLIVATLSSSTHHTPGSMDDMHFYTPPSDGSAHEGFPALENELAIFRLHDLSGLERYTSLASCCPDIRDVPPDDFLLGHLVPDESLRIVAGALPTALAIWEDEAGRELYVAYGGSNAVQRFNIEAGGALTGGPVVTVGLDPRGLVVNEERQELYVSNRLGESLTVIDLERFEAVAEVWLGPTDAPPFPATDAELGELIFFSGAAFSVDGGQTCNHCHLDRGNLGKFFSMPLLYDTRGSRMTKDTRGLFDTRPWYFEGAVGEEDASFELEEMAYLYNFCCEEHPEPEVCAVERPPPCDEAPYIGRPATRDAFFLEVARELIGRERSFGEALDVALDFDGVVRLLGLYLIHEPALLPNPNRGDLADVERGRLLFESPLTGCVFCHPAPIFGISTDVNPFEMPILFGPVISPNRDMEGNNIDLVRASFRERFPGVTQEGGDLHIKSPALRGLWDRAPGFYHDGRAPTLRQALVPTGHPALDSEELGYNVADGIVDSHGGTSHLSSGELDDLIRFLLTL
ncbi:MAG: hypothetical protein ACNA8W_04945 [Bradymonadaceae bacterium]